MGIYIRAVMAWSFLPVEAYILDNVLPCWSEFTYKDFALFVLCVLRSKKINGKTREKQS